MCFCSWRSTDLLEIPRRVGDPREIHSVYRSEFRSSTGPVYKTSDAMSNLLLRRSLLSIRNVHLKAWRSFQWDQLMYDHSRECFEIPVSSCDCDRPDRESIQQPWFMATLECLVQSYREIRRLVSNESEREFLNLTILCSQRKGLITNGMLHCRKFGVCPSVLSSSLPSALLSVCPECFA